MKKFFTIFFVTLGVIFFCIIIAGAYFYITDPLNLKPLLFGANDQTMTSSPNQAADDTSSDTVTPAQEAALQSVGIDSSEVLSTITPEQEACFVEVLGAARVEEVKAGAVPTASEYFAARHCLE